MTAAHHPEERLRALDLTVPAPPPALAHYALTVRTGDLLFLAGHAPLRDGEFAYVGKVGREFTEQEGYDAARSAVGMAQLHYGMAIEIEGVVEVSP